MANTNERKPVMEVMLEIHKLVDMDLVNEITDFLHEKKGLKVNEVTAVFGYLMADAIAQGENITHEDICNLSETYCAYVHNMAHSFKNADKMLDDFEHSAKLQ